MIQPGCQQLWKGRNIFEENSHFSQFSSRTPAPVQQQGEFAAIYEAFLWKGCLLSVGWEQSWGRPRGAGGILGKRQRAGKARAGWRRSLGAPGPNLLGLMVAEAATFPLMALVAGGCRSQGPPVQRGPPSALTCSLHCGVCAGRDRPRLKTHCPYVGSINTLPLAGTVSAWTFRRWDKQP